MPSFAETYQRVQQAIARTLAGGEEVVTAPGGAVVLRVGPRDDKLLKSTPPMLRKKLEHTCVLWLAPCDTPNLRLGIPVSAERDSVINSELVLDLMCSMGFITEHERACFAAARN